MPSNRRRGDISRNNLQKHGIDYYEEVVHPPLKLPEHVDAVREILLSLKANVPDGGWGDTLQEEAEVYGYQELRPESLHPAYSPSIITAAHEKGLGIRSSEWHTAYEDLESSEKAAKLARGLEADSEEGWAHFWKSNIFTIAGDRTRVQPGFHPILDNWSLEGNCLWTEFRNLRPQNDNLVRLTQPKPDLAYAFPILNSCLGGYERDEFNKGFSLESFRALMQRDFICTPTTGFRKWMKSPDGTILASPDLACFPWAIVEFKKNSQPSSESVEKRGYCQAANASAAALDLHIPLFSKSCPEEDSEVPPVISFTCVGHIVKVWLTYLEKLGDSATWQRRMVCICKTSVQLTWGVAVLRAIIRNMHTWSSRLLKPKLQAAVAQALKLPCRIRAPKPRTSDIDITSLGVFETPLGNPRAVSQTTLLSPTSAPLSGGNRSPPVFFTIPPSTGPLEFTTFEVRGTNRANKKTEFLEILLPDDGMEEKGSEKSNSIKQLTGQFHKSMLDSPASQSNSPPHGPVKGNGVLEHDPLGHQTPTRSSGVDKIKDLYSKAHSTSGSLNTSRVSGRPISSARAARVLTVPSSSSASNAGPDANTGTLSPFVMPQSSCTSESVATPREANDRTRQSSPRPVTPVARAQCASFTETHGPKLPIDLQALPGRSGARRSSADAEANKEVDVGEVPARLASRSLSGSKKTQTHGPEASPSAKKKKSKSRKSLNRERSKERPVDADAARHGLNIDKSGHRNGTNSKTGTPNTQKTAQSHDWSGARASRENRSVASRVHVGDGGDKPSTYFPDPVSNREHSPIGAAHDQRRRQERIGWIGFPVPILDRKRGNVTSR